MAEFQEVMKQRKRMCEIFDCADCPLSHDNNGTRGALCDEFIREYPADAEPIIMKWAAAHPEPKYPTWVKWWNENFGSKGRRMFTPCSFVPPAELGCSIGMDGCMTAPYKCWHTPIPADIAEKLGIEPINQ